MGGGGSYGLGDSHRTARVIIVGDCIAQSSTAQEQFYGIDSIFLCCPRLGGACRTTPRHWYVFALSVLKVCSSIFPT